MISKEEFAKMQDHSVLEADTTEEIVKNHIKEALEYGFVTVYVHPCYVKMANEIVAGRLNVGTTVGFPLGANTTKVKITEGLEAIENGANELDIVINISKLKSGDYGYVQRELEEFVSAMKNKNSSIVVKVIIETSYLTHDEKITACKLVVASGADYIKNSTGCAPTGFKIGDIRLIKKTVGDSIKVKASAGITTIEDALAAIQEGAVRIGENTAVKLLREFDKQLWY